MLVFLFRSKCLHIVIRIIMTSQALLQHVASSLPVCSAMYHCGHCFYNPYSSTWLLPSVSEIRVKITFFFYQLFEPLQWKDNIYPVESMIWKGNTSITLATSARNLLDYNATKNRWENKVISFKNALVVLMFLLLICLLYAAWL